MTSYVLRRLVVGPLSNNAYLVRDTQTDEVLLVDAAAEPDKLLASLAEITATAPHSRLTTVLTTHRHPDHWQALAEIIAATGARHVAGRNDADAIPVPADTLLSDGGTLEIGALRLPIVELIGHTPGSIAVVLPGAKGGPTLAGTPTEILTGDALFPGGVRKTATPADFARLLGDVKTRIFERFDDATVIHPGHGEPSTLGAERPHLPEWAARGW